MGDVVGSAVCLIGVLIVMLWPRDGGGLEADGDAPIAKSLRRLLAAASVSYTHLTLPTIRSV